jgi:hypothetical protein
MPTVCKDSRHFCVFYSEGSAITIKSRMRKISKSK